METSQEARGQINKQEEKTQSTKLLCKINAQFESFLHTQQHQAAFNILGIFSSHLAS